MPPNRPIFFGMIYRERSRRVLCRHACTQLRCISEGEIWEERKNTRRNMREIS